MYFQCALLPLFESIKKNVPIKKCVELASDFQKRIKNITIFGKFSRKVVLNFYKADMTRNFRDMADYLSDLDTSY